ncbi:MAG: hypothetical protein SFU91_07505 [Chloroherpetonaceae bacterium]|nr:hypothetical protein [Chloroherpetonaceae bacterium]
MSFSCGRSNRVIDRETYTIYLALQDTVQKLQVYGYARLRYFRIAESALSKGIESTGSNAFGNTKQSLLDSLLTSLNELREGTQLFSVITSEIQNLKPNSDHPDSVVRFILHADSLSTIFHQQHDAINQETKRAEKLYLAYTGKRWSLDSLPRQIPLKQSQ